MNHAASHFRGFCHYLLIVVSIIGLTAACDSGEESISCPDGQLACDGVCTDPLSDGSNCGECNWACGAASTCSAGECLDPDGAAVPPVATAPGECAPGQLNCTDACVTGEIKCGLDCVSTLTSTAHCGACGTVCAATESCNAGACGCAPTDTRCGDSCSDLLSDAANCGGCGAACADRQSCSSGACECPAGELFCAEACSDPMTDNSNCGACGSACMGGTICTAGNCECPVGQTSCDDLCTDTMADDANCGGCGMLCVGGQTCQAGACACPEGQTLCDDACVDITSDDAHCGACGASCELGESCNESTCEQGGMGEDGCSGLAQGIEIDKISLYQTVEIPIVENGNAVQERGVDVVAGRQTLVRVFANVGNNWTGRMLSGRLFLGDDGGRTVLYTAAPQMVTESSFDDQRNQSFDAARQSTFEFMVDQLDLDQPDSVTITDSSSYVVELVECGQAPGLPVRGARFPAAEALDLGAVDTGPMKVMFIPLTANNRTAETTDEALEPLIRGIEATYPSATIVHTVRDAVNIQDPRAWSQNLDSLRDLRAQDGAADDVYYYGLLRPTERFNDFCNGGCVAGIGYVPDARPRSAGRRVSLGLAYDEQGVNIMLHELGHNFGRQHAPCGGVAGADRNYPHPNARLGVRGYDLLGDRIISQDTPDIMAYCPNPWFSDYTYAGMIGRLQAVNNARQSLAPEAQRVGDFRVLLTELGKPAFWGHPIKNGVASGEAESALVLDANGIIVDNIEVYRTEISDIDAFSIEIPEPRPGWHAIQLVDHAPVAF